MQLFTLFNAPVVAALLGSALLTGLTIVTATAPVVAFTDVKPRVAA